MLFCISSEGLVRLLLQSRMESINQYNTTQHVIQVIQQDRISRVFGSQ